MSDIIRHAIRDHAALEDALATESRDRRRTRSMFGTIAALRVALPAPQREIVG
jgi:hypothetical protein